MNEGNLMERGPSASDTVRSHNGEVPQQQLANSTLPPVARLIVIEPLNHGYVVTVGCQKFAVENVDAVLHRLGGYLKDPSVHERKWLEGELKW